MRFNVIDLETTDDGPEAEVIEIASRLIHEGSVFHGCMNDLFNYTGKMSPVARAVHCLEDAQLRKHPVADPVRLRWLLHDWCSGHGEVVCVAHNSEFEQRFLAEASAGMRWLCTYKAALRVWPDAPRHSNGVLYYWLREQGKVPNLGHEAHPMHRAGPDTLITAHILLALLEEASAEDMIRWTDEPRFMSTCPIGKFRGKPWPEVEAGFLHWMLKQPDMEADLKWNAQRELDRRATQ